MVGEVNRWLTERLSTSQRETGMTSLATILRGGIVAAGLVALGLGSAFAASISVTSNITASETWTADNEYILTQVIYVTDGATLTIEPGTVIRGEGESSPGANDPGTLVVSRGAKIRALGTEQDPVIFTDLLDDNFGSNTGTFPYDSVENALSLTEQWGGVILLGRGYVASDTLAGPDAAREAQIEGLTPAGGLGLYGGGGDDDDDSGSMRYVSIRYGGFNLSANNEINGLTLGAVGRATDLEFIEVYQNKDDGVEFFGGAANIKHLIILSPGDDGVDYDQGWRGKIQFVFQVQGLPGSDKSDKGGEHDGGTSPDGSQPFAIPTIYNATYIGHGQKDFASKGKDTAIKFRDNAGGRYYNSFFADFAGATATIEGLPGSANTSAERARTAYAIDNTFFFGPVSTYQLELEDNDWWCFGSGGRIPDADATDFGGDSGKDHFDNGAFTDAALDNTYFDCLETLPIRALSRIDSGDPTLPDPATTVDPLPANGSSLWTTDRQAPQDGFFEEAAYKGAFGKTNWARGWTNMDRLGYFPPKPLIDVDADVDVSQIWTADNEYLLKQVIYVKDGATLTIEPGTVVRAEGESSPGANDPGTLVVSRGSKINAVGTASMPIVFTDQADDNVGEYTGTFPYDAVENALSLTEQWGGVILLGRGYVASDTLAGPNAAREAQIEGLTPAGGLGLYGGGGNDDDDSGTMKFVSIRYGGFNLSANNEINGLTLGAVGRETELDFIEVYQNKDDGVEFFGGAANIKHLVILAPGDDGVDYDQGWRGKLQYVFQVQGLPGSDKSDKGGEHDGGTSPDGSQPFAIPTIYNATYIGHGQKDFASKGKDTAIKFRDNAGGRYYNSFFADFAGATATIEGLPGAANTSAERARTAYTVDDTFFFEPTSTYQLELEDNDWWCMGSGGRIPDTDATDFGGDSGKDHFDNGAFTDVDLDNTYFDCASTLPIRLLTRIDSGDPTLPNPATKVDPRPAAGSTLAVTNRETARDGFFDPAGYKGAFRPGQNWAAGWTNMARLGYFPTCAEDAAATPNEAMNLVFVSKDDLKWDAPFGDDWSGFDLLRSVSASDFSTPTCIEEQDADTAANDSADPPAGTAFFYLVRPKNACGDATLGLGENASTRGAAGSCL